LAVVNLEIKPLSFKPDTDKLNDYLINGKDEILLNEIDEGETEDSVISIPKKRISQKKGEVWTDCIKKNNVSERGLYCKNHFTNEYQIKKCAVRLILIKG
jgi:hypothetical protein